MSNVERAKQILAKLDKAQTGLMLMDMPAVASSTEDERLRAKEGNEALYPSEQHSQDVIRLGRKIMMIDGNQYGVSSAVANKIAEYVERNEDTVLEEMESLYALFLKDFYKNVANARKMNRNEFASDEDFSIAVSYIKRKTSEFENKLHYLYHIIQVIREHENEVDDEEEDNAKFNDQFDFSFLNTNYATGNPINFSSTLR